ncbi:thioredoxin reductase [Candidatus Peregrinibacteria bacterium CG_4_9_14_3_um_filter_49_12]|nr:MAG: thioredoxin reductase [Candidatus Peregrinibacteria bacterium CG11_big_fil_rev_8_21_14_0_20_49_14]PJA67969.1 MAG: thioredoxin reductase [Candidatus Peregrinibacteria bacterium CG_4_9_14_3_um_filter_49_12]
MYDALIIGLGCAGYTAAIYTARYKLSTFIVGAEEGGLGMTAAEVGNWPGNIDITGPDLMENFKKHALSFDAVTHKIARVKSVEKVAGGFQLTLDGGETVQGKTVIFAMGSNKRHLGAPGEKEFSGKGVTYCATCDAFFYKGKDVAVLGGGDAAVEGAAIAAQVAKKVYLIHRRNEFRAEPYWVDKVKARENVVFVLERNVVEILGDQKVKAVKLDKPFEGSDTITLDGVFIEIGATPATEIPKALGCAVDQRGFLTVNGAQQTTVPGVFGAGDITTASNFFAQFTTAAGEGAVAANSVFNYVSTAGAKMPA